MLANLLRDFYQYEFDAIFDGTLDRWKLEPWMLDALAQPWTETNDKIHLYIFASIMSCLAFDNYDMVLDCEDGFLELVKQVKEVAKNYNNPLLDEKFNLTPQETFEAAEGFLNKHWTTEEE